MNKKIKASIYFLFISLFAIVLVACSSKVKEKDIDEQTINNLVMMSDNFIAQLSSLDEQSLDETIENLNDNSQFELETALLNWKSAKGELGNIQIISTDEAKVIFEDESYTVSLPVVGEKRAAIVKINYDKNIKKINSMSINPNYSLGEKLSKAALNTLIGMVTVFIILIFIIFIISLFKYVKLFEDKLRKQKADSEKVEEAISSKDNLEENLMEDEELVAVITAAIMAYETEEVDDDLLVRSLKRAKRNRKF